MIDNSLKTRMIMMLGIVINHFNSENRAIIGEECVYHPTITSIGCGIGMFISDKDLCRQLTLCGDVNDIIQEYAEYLPEWMMEMDSKFLTRIQTLHDNEENWNTAGLSKSGLTQVYDIIIKHGLTEIHNFIADL